MTVDKRVDGKGSEAFFARWARLKQSGEARELPPKDEPTVSLPAAGAMPSTSTGAPIQAKMPEEPHPEPSLPVVDAPVALPSLDSLTPQSDFSPFMARDVDPQLRNLAMKKLFTDPHYNVMDRLDIYIDDYSVHAPLSLDVIRQMNISKTLGLFDDEEEAAKVAVDAAEAEATPGTEAAVESGPLALDGKPAPAALVAEKNAAMKQSSA